MIDKRGNNERLRESQALPPSLSPAWSPSNRPLPRATPHPTDFLLKKGGLPRDAQRLFEGKDMTANT